MIRSIPQKMKIQFKLPVLIAMLASLLSCTTQTTETAETPQTNETASTAAVNVSLKDASQNTILKQYLLLKDALVLSDATKTQEAAKTLQQSLAASKEFETSQAAADSIAKTNDLAQQRKTFTNLSNQLISVFRKAAVAKGAFYVQFCPMANEGDGGYWLAQEEEVRNPYYGDEMLNCGEVKEKIK